MGLGRGQPWGSLIKGWLGRGRERIRTLVYRDASVLGLSADFMTTCLSIACGMDTLLVFILTHPPGCDADQDRY